HPTGGLAVACLLRNKGSGAVAMVSVTATTSSTPTPTSRANVESLSSGAIDVATRRSVPDKLRPLTNTPTRNCPAKSAAPDIPAHGDLPVGLGGLAVDTTTS